MSTAAAGTVVAAGSAAGGNKDFLLIVTVLILIHCVFSGTAADSRICTVCFETVPKRKSMRTQGPPNLPNGRTIGRCCVACYGRAQRWAKQLSTNVSGTVGFANHSREVMTD